MTKLGGLSKIQTSQHLLMKETGFPITLKAINLVDCMGLEPMSDQKCDGAHLIMLLRLLTVHVTFLDNPYSSTFKPFFNLDLAISGYPPANQYVLEYGTSC